MEWEQDRKEAPKKVSARYKLFLLWRFMRRWEGNRPVSEE